MAPLSQDDSVKQAFKHCIAVAKNHYENFPVASWATPKKLRPHVCAVYAFARTADDYADEKQFDGKRMERLNEWEEYLKGLEQKKAWHPVFKALQVTAETFKIPHALFFDLIYAFKMDVLISRYETFEQVLNYCRYSANPVGRIILHIFGYPAPKFMEYSDAICTALQLANFWQDIAVDLDQDRIYIPKEDFYRFRYPEADLKSKIYNDAFRRLMFFQVDRTQEIFERGRLLGAKIPGRLGFELRATWLGGMAILDKIKALNGNVLEHRPVIGRKDAAGILMKALRKRKFASPGE